MRFLSLLGLLTLSVARPALAESPEPDERGIDLGPPPPPPPGANVADEPSPPAPNPTVPAPEPASPAPDPIPPAPAPIAPAPPKPEPASAPKDLGAGAPRRKAAGGWYGWKILIADGGALILTVSTPPLGPILGGGAYLLTAPSIHLGHRRGLVALGSLGMRIAAPLALHAMIGEESCGSPDPCIQPGVIAGAMLASLIDVTFLAHDSADSKAKKAERVAPTVAVGPKGTILGVVGAF